MGRGTGGTVHTATGEASTDSSTRPARALLCDDHGTASLRYTIPASISSLLTHETCVPMLAMGSHRP